MTLYRIEIDHSSCVGYAGCVREAPDVFWIEDGLAYAEASTGDASALPSIMARISAKDRWECAGASS